LPGNRRAGVHRKNNYLSFVDRYANALEDIDRAITAGYKKAGRGLSASP